MWLLACSEAVESKLAKLETSRLVILPPRVGGLKWKEIETGFYCSYIIIIVTTGRVLITP